MKKKKILIIMLIKNKINSYSLTTYHNKQNILQTPNDF